MRATKRRSGYSVSESKKSRRDGGAATEDVFFERENDASDSEAAEESTAEEKKLALGVDPAAGRVAIKVAVAKAYLAKVGAEVNVSDDEHDAAIRDRLHADQERPIQNVASRVAVSETELLAHHSFYPASKWEPTRLAVTSDCRVVYLVDKNGGISHYDTETGHKTKIAFERDFGKLSAAVSAKAPWVSRTGSYGIPKRAFIAAAISDDHKLLAVGGGDKHIHIFDTTSHTCIHSFSGHREAVSGLAFQSGSRSLFSCSYDRTVKVWSVDDFGYVDTLYGHQSEVLDIDAAHPTKLLTVGNDRSCRIWKTLTDSQLVFRAPSLSMDCGRLLDGTSFVTGSSAGLQLWSVSKKKPVSVVQNPHVTSTEHGWIQSLGVSRGGDLIASGAGDGRIRLWHAEKDAKGRFASLQALGAGLAAKGCVTSVHVSADGQLVISAVARRPRLGHWASDTTARQGILIHRIEIRD